MKRKRINMDGSLHGPEDLPYHEDVCCEIDEPIKSTSKTQMYCGAPCKCGGIIHWQPIYGGYYFQCDGCETSGISHEDL
ncbi:MAG: hypothetical protein ACYSWP_22475, partial [Planctomycetota bacterium]